MHCIYALYVFYALYAYPEGVELTLKLVGDGPTDQPTNRPTDGRTLSYIELLSQLKTRGLNQVELWQIFRFITRFNLILEVLA